MSLATHRVIRRDGGSAYDVGAAISEAYPTRELAHAAALRFG